MDCPVPPFECASHRVAGRGLRLPDSPSGEFGVGSPGCQLSGQTTDWGRWAWQPSGELGQWGGYWVAKQLVVSGGPSWWALVVGWQAGLGLRTLWVPDLAGARPVLDPCRVWGPSGGDGREGSRNQAGPGRAQVGARDTGTRGPCMCQTPAALRAICCPC